MGIKNLGAFNLALLGKWVWRARLETDSLWLRVLKARYGGLGTGRGLDYRSGSSWWWSINSLDEGGHGFSDRWLAANLVRTVGEGRNVHFWRDVWIGEVSLAGGG